MPERPRGSWTTLPGEREQAIRERAYAIWEEEGRPDGKALDHWLRALSEHDATSRNTWRNFWNKIFPVLVGGALQPTKGVATRNLAERRPRRHSIWRRIDAIVNRPLGAALITFLLTGIVAAIFSKWLDELSKTHELEIAS